MRGLEEGSIKLDLVKPGEEINGAEEVALDARKVAESVRQRPRGVLGAKVNPPI